MSIFVLFESNPYVPRNIFPLLTELQCCLSYVKQTSMERKGNLIFSFIDWRSRDRTCETKHTGSNFMLIENALLSLMSSIQCSH